LGSVNQSSDTPFPIIEHWLLTAHFHERVRREGRIPPRRKEKIGWSFLIDKKGFHRRGHAGSIQFLNLWSSVGISLPHAASCLWRGRVC
jgi:hypothetical protein